MARESRSPLKDAEGIEEWLDLIDQALQGLHHALNNRIGSLSALIELLRLDGLPSDGTGFDGLTSELLRLEDCSRLVRLLPGDSSADAEPLILDDVLADVFLIHRFLHAVREVPVTIVPVRFVEPVRVERWAVLRVLTLLLNDAKRLAGQLGEAARIVAESDDQWVSVEFRVGTPAVHEVPVSGRGRYSETVARSFGGTVSRAAGVVALRMPTLKALRAADRQ